LLLRCAEAVPEAQELRRRLEAADMALATVQRAHTEAVERSAMMQVGWSVICGGQAERDGWTWLCLFLSCDCNVG
jgi:hypothetical protein